MSEEMQVKKSILMAQIGRGNYLDVDYVNVKYDDNDELQLNPVLSGKTGYTFYATLNELKNNHDIKIDTVVLIGTRKSLWGSLYGYYMGLRDKDFENRNIKDEEEQKAENRRLSEESLQKIREAINLEDKSLVHFEKDPNKFISIDRMEDEQVRGVVEKFLTEKVGTNVKILIVENGISDRELQMNFSLLKDGLAKVIEDYHLIEKNENKIDLYMDISNGFRSLPMYFYSFASYMGRIREETYRIIMYYGMADARFEYGNRAPLVRLDQLTGLMQWINAVNEFQNTGSVRELVRIFKDNEDWNIETGRDAYPKLENVFTMFDYASYANNLKVLEETIEIIKTFQNTETEEKYQSLPESARLLLQSMGKEFHDRFEINADFKYANLTVQLARWYFEQDRIGSAAIAAQEAIMTYLLEKYAKDSFSKPQEVIEKYDIRDKVKNLIINKDDDESKRISVNNVGDLNETYNRIRENVRNTEAHFLYKDADIENVKQYKGDIDWILDCMEKEIKNKGESIFSNMEDKIQSVVRPENSEEQIFKILGEIAGKLDTADINSYKLPEDIFGNLKKLQAGIIGMIERTKKNDKKDFCQWIKSNIILDTCLHEWLKDFEDADVYNKAFKKNRGKPGYERLMNYYGIHGRDLCQILQADFDSPVSVNTVKKGGA